MDRPFNFLGEGSVFFKARIIFYMKNLHFFKTFTRIYYLNLQGEINYSFYLSDQDLFYKS
jgi:hypothetical protein